MLIGGKRILKRLKMKILITSNSHKHYGRVGEITAKGKDGSYIVRIPNKDGSIQTSVKEKQFKDITTSDLADFQNFN
jgi:hypothetical protein